ncbi:MAG TPA: cyclase family protein [Candidatus Limnocylindrales bacterium]|nr:cyclase family protein [Candidatus Limnocylindrales bacterium]
MTGRIIDISLPIQPGLPTWPTSEGFATRRAMAIEAGDPANVTVVEMDVHTGTHVESGLHFLADGAPIESLALDQLVGVADVVEVPGDRVTAAALAAAGVPHDCRRLLVKTANSARWAAGWGPFDPVYVSLTPDAARWIAERGIVLVGIDHLSIQTWEDDGETHRTLMRAGIAILEGLNLADAAPGRYTLVAAPIRLVGTEAAPARALLIESGTVAP